jgi:hypothetical protein
VEDIFMSNIGYKLSTVKRTIYSIISFLKVLIPIFTIETEIMKSVEFLQPFFLNVFDFLSENLNIVIFVGLTTLITGAFTYFIFPIGETACLVATAIGYLLSPRIEETFTTLVEGGATAWQAGAECAPWIFWICLPTLFVGAICVCKRVTKWGGLVKTLLIGGLITLIVGILLGVLALVAYGTGFVANPARTCMLVAMALVTVAEQVAIFQKEI